MIGFGFRNASYNEQNSSTAAEPEYFFLWLYLASGLVVYIFSMIASVWESRIPTLLAFIFIPFFMVSVGAVLFLDGLLIYMFHQGNNNTVTLTCSDAQNTNEANIIHGEQNYVIIEFAGALAAVAFYWVYMMMIPFFSSKKDADRYGTY